MTNIFVLYSITLIFLVYMFHFLMKEILHLNKLIMDGREDNCEYTMHILNYTYYLHYVSLVEKNQSKTSVVLKTLTFKEFLELMKNSREKGGNFQDFQKGLGDSFNEQINFNDFIEYMKREEDNNG